MVTPRKIWLALSGAILAVIACSFSATTPMPTLPPTLVSPAALPSPTITPDPMAGLAGSWLEPDNTGTVTTIIALNGGYTVDSMIDPNQGKIEITSTDWSKGVLTWTYCRTGDACVTNQTDSFIGESLDIHWWTGPQNGGYKLLQRVDPASATKMERLHSLEGIWRDPDTSGTYHIIVWQNGGYVVTDTKNPNRGENEITSSKWENGVLTWTYCVPAGACVTTQTISVSGDYLYTSWSNDHGNSGHTTLQFVSASPATSVETMPGLAGIWRDPLSAYTYHVIVWRDAQYMVTETRNTNRPLNEIHSTDWSKGVLTWTYCPTGGACVTVWTTSLDGDSLYTSWYDDWGNSGDKTLQRVTSLPTTSVEAVHGLAGDWESIVDGSITNNIILWQDDRYVVAETRQQDGSANLLASSTWENGVLTWTYCIPGGTCITIKTTSVKGDILFIKWSDDQGKIGETALSRMP